MKTAIVTGANGFVGNAVTQELLMNGYRIYAVVRENHCNNLPKNKNIIYISCDLSEVKCLPQKLPTLESIDVFYHFAWAGSTGEKRGDYDLQIKNIQWTLDAAHIAKEIGCSKFVGIGTLAELDVNVYAPLQGSKPNIVSCYGAAKIAAHYMSKAECNRLGIEHIWVRLANVYGIGNFTSNFVNFAAKTMLTGQETNFSSGEQMYDFVHIDDVAQALYYLGQKGQKNITYFVGSSKPAKLKEFIQLIRDEIDSSISLNLGAVPFDGVAHSKDVFDCSRLIEDTGYHPQVLFQDGIRKTIPWIKTQIREGRI